jgi:hypothetical protein
MTNARSLALAWLERQQPPPPFDLERRLVRALERTESTGANTAEVLADAALESLASAARAGAERTAANDLLTADALLTYAIESATEESVAALDALLNRLQLNRFDELLAEHERR